MLRVYHVLRAKGVRLIGPNCPGLTTVGEAKVGIIPGNIHARGPVGLVSRSGTLTYEVVQAMTDAGMGQTTTLGIGGDPIVGTSFIDALDLFNQDPETEAIVMIGEIGGEEEEKAAAFVRPRGAQADGGFIAGRTAPPGRRMGHAGAIISTAGGGTAESKRAALEEAGVRVADSPSHIPRLLRDAGVTLAHRDSVTSPDPRVTRHGWTRGDHAAHRSIRMSLSSVRLGRALVVLAMAGVLAACTSEADPTPEATEPRTDRLAERDRGRSNRDRDRRPPTTRPRPPSSWPIPTSARSSPMPTA